MCYIQRVERKKVHEILQDFTKIIHECDPMGVRSPDGNEYACEALTILARFYEAALMGAPAEVRSELATAIIAQALEYWFDEPSSSDYSQMTARLIETFVQEE